ncbi:MAG: isochorismate synthase [Bacteroidetes bacterium CG12_big_fil_rev_8_21_14_0_65_60_17]|nr:MAG: isochorismate synthase [Bacteroidetes bacterium CG12_big_fil_rev_8_21_14_0_65_60_17]
MYWRGRHADDMTAMTGEAMVVEGHGRPDWTRMEKDLDGILHRPGANLRFHGGMRFNLARHATSDWFEFPAYRFVLPRFEWHQRGSKTLLCCNLVLPEDGEDLREVLREVDELVLPDPDELRSVPLPRTRTDNPGFEGWKTQIRWSLDAFSQDILQKVVLARRVDVQFAASLEAATLLSTLQESTPNCFHYLVESPSGAVFMGASPERLFFRRGREVFSEAVAGTRPRGNNVQDDEAYRESLLASEKDQREHAYVREYIRSVLEAQCDEVTVDEVASEMRLAGGRHLCSRLSGTLRPDISDLDLLRTLHPTPAVGGAPTADALDIIDSLEDFDRGWYAGPIGWIGRDSAEFAVALRCGVVEGRQLTLFSGAGIVKGSEPGAEWLEIEQKITDFTHILGVSVRDAS